MGNVFAIHAADQGSIPSPQIGLIPQDKIGASPGYQELESA